MLCFRPHEAWPGVDIDWDPGANAGLTQGGSDGCHAEGQPTLWDHESDSDGRYHIFASLLLLPPREGLVQLASADKDGASPSAILWGAGDL